MGDSSSSQSPDAALKEPRHFYNPLIGMTCMFAAIFIFGPLFVRKGPNKGIIKCCIMMTAVCIWLFWSTIYIVQLNPLMGPRMKNCTVAWIAYKYGDPLIVGSHDDTSPP